MVIRETDPRLQLHLPPGFRFYPTDEELLVQYLCRKIAGYHFSLQIIGDIDLYKFNPWDLPNKALFGEKEWYFFSPRDRKYPNGSRPNRVAGAGYWKATGTDKIITTEGRKVGIKKALVFYTGKAPRGTKTNWIMHEYRLWEPAKKNGGARLDDWVLCRIYKKKSNGQKPATEGGSPSSSSSPYEEGLDSLPELNADGFFNLPCFNMEAEDHKPINLQKMEFDWASGSGLGPYGPKVIQVQDVSPTGVNMEIQGFGNDIFAHASAVFDNELQSWRERNGSNQGFNGSYWADARPNMVNWS